MVEYVKIEGELSWVKTKQPETWGEDSYWSVTIHPTQEYIPVILDLQSQGVKNTLKKDDKGYFIKFKCPVSKKTKTGKVLMFEAPTVYASDGKTVLQELVGNGSKGVVKLEAYEHGTPGGGKAKAVRLNSVMVTELIPYGGNSEAADGEEPF